MYRTELVTNSQNIFNSYITKILKEYSSFINIKILDKYKKYEIQTF